MPRAIVCNPPTMSSVHYNIIMKTTGENLYSEQQVEHFVCPLAGERREYVELLLVCRSVHGDTATGVVH